MNNVDELILEMRAALRRQTMLSGDELFDLARKYSQACVEANKRLSRAAFYLRRGFRSEAVRQCEFEPKLLDLLSLLDFVERDHWTQYCSQLQLPLPPELAVEAAIELNEAYNQEEQVASLSKKFRRQNLARAPREVRLQTAHQLVQNDSTSVVWQENLQRLANG